MLPSDPLPALEGEACLSLLSDPPAEVRLFSYRYFKSVACT